MRLKNQNLNPVRWRAVFTSVTKVCAYRNIFTAHIPCKSRPGHMRSYAARYCSHVASTPGGRRNGYRRQSPHCRDTITVVVRPLVGRVLHQLHVIGARQLCELLLPYLHHHAEHFRICVHGELPAVLRALPFRDQLYPRPLSTGVESNIGECCDEKNWHSRAAHTQL